MATEQNGANFLDRILQRALEGLAEHPEFDDRVIQKLRNLTQTAGFTDYKQVVQALNVGEVEQHEAS